MLEALILDKTAESRNKIRNKLCDFIFKGAQGVDIIPRINVKPISVEEIKFQTSPRLIIIGSEILKNDKKIISEIKTYYPQVAIIAWLTPELNKLFVIEELARLGVTDICQDSIQAGEFFRKLIILSRKTKKAQNSKIILVDSAKGGSGVTSIAASLGEIYLDNKKKVLLIDCDVESQDLSRFLQVRPFVNENLGLILDGLKPISLESLKECYQKVWDDEENFYCMSPTPESENIYSNKSPYYKNFLSVLEVLDTEFDYIIIDLACFKGILKTSLYKICDLLLVVMNNDPASIFSNLELIKNAKNFLSANAKLLVVDNSHEVGLLPFDILREEVMSSANIMQDSFFEYSINKSRDAQRWPGSGATLYSQAPNQLKEVLEMLSFKIDGKEYQKKEKESVLKLYAQKIKTLGQKLLIALSGVFKRNKKVVEEDKLIERKDIISLPERTPWEGYKEIDSVPFEKKEEEAKDLFTKAV